VFDGRGINDCLTYGEVDSVVSGTRRPTATSGMVSRLALIAACGSSPEAGLPGLSFSVTGLAAAAGRSAKKQASQQAGYQKQAR
jgi:hypothetical protein